MRTTRAQRARLEPERAMARVPSTGLARRQVNAIMPNVSGEGDKPSLFGDVSCLMAGFPMDRILRIYAERAYRCAMSVAVT